jgi:hypothetical protein
MTSPGFAFSTGVEGATARNHHIYVELQTTAFSA